jgi:Raf kinase inhibitor-like YbhB/YbcL family protein
MTTSPSQAHEKWMRGAACAAAALSIAVMTACGSGDDTVVPADSGAAPDTSTTPDTGTSADAGATGDATTGADTGATADTGGDAPKAADASTDAGIVVTSPAFTEGMTIPDMFTCAGVDTSPEVDWTPGPAGTLSYALVVSDTTATANIHWVVWDIPTTTLSLPANLPGTPTLTAPAGAKQVDLRTNPEAGTTMNGYFGPCPRGALHGYEFAVHAMNVATLPGVTTMSRSADVKTAVIANTLAQGTLNGTSTANTPADAGGQ